MPSRIDVPPRVPPRRNAPATSGAEPSAPHAAPTSAADRLFPTAEGEGERDRDHRADDEADQRAPEDGRGGEAERRPEPHEDPDRVPVPHDHECTFPPAQASSRAITARVNCAARAPSTTRWSNVTLMFPMARTTISPSRTTGRGPMR